MRIFVTHCAEIYDIYGQSTNQEYLQGLKNKIGLGTRWQVGNNGQGTEILCTQLGTKLAKLMTTLHPCDALIKWYLIFQVIIFPKVTVNVDLPPNFSLFTVGAYSGLEISLSTGIITKATLTTSPASVISAASITTGVQVACLRFDAEANTFTFIDGAKYNTDKTMTVDLPKAGFYAFVSASATVPIPTIYAEARATSSTMIKTISYPGGELILGLQTTSHTMIKCTKKLCSTTADLTYQRSIGAFFDIELEKEEEIKKGEIKYKYDSDAVAAVRTDPSHFTYTRAYEHTPTHTHVFSVSFSLSLAHTCTHKYTHMPAFFLVRTLYVAIVSPHANVCVPQVCAHTSLHKRAHLLSWVHIWS